MSKIVKKTEIELKNIIEQAVKKAVSNGALPEAEMPQFNIEKPANKDNGDYSTNVAMAGARAFKKAPRMIAEAIASCIDLDGTAFERVEIAGPGFMNFFLSQQFYSNVLKDVFSCGKDYGKSDYGQGKRVLVEFVSANPTGPMHIGNARGGAIGDCLASVLDWAGFSVNREFYVNDAGNQIEKFATSLEVRYLQHYDSSIELPEDAYHGQDIVEHAENFIKEYGDKYVNADSKERRKALVDFALPKNIAGLERDLGRYRITYDKWFRESTLHNDGSVQRVIDALKEKGVTYEQDGALWFKASEYGNDKDIVLVRANGLPTYIVPDIAYHYNKLVTRGYDKAIDVLGADHHGYIGRMMAMCAAFGDEPGKNMQILIGQLVNVMKDGKPVRMSKRAGNVVTIDDLVSVVGVDAARYSLARSDYNQNFDIDLALLASHTNDNPVYYVQYAHARSKNVDRNAAAAGISYEGADLALLDTEADGEVLAALAQFPSVLATAADDRQPHKVARYLEELAATYHKWYNVERVVPMALTDPETRGDDEARKALEIAKNPEPARAAARLKLNDAVQQVIANGLDLLGVTAPEKM